MPPESTVGGEVGLAVSMTRGRLMRGLGERAKVRFLGEFCFEVSPASLVGLEAGSSFGDGIV